MDYITIQDLLNKGIEPWDENDETKEHRRLFCAVVVQAFRDLASCNPQRSKEAEIWLRGSVAASYLRIIGYSDARQRIDRALKIYEHKKYLFTAKMELIISAHDSFSPSVMAL